MWPSPMRISLLSRGLASPMFEPSWDRKDAWDIYICEKIYVFCALQGGSRKVGFVKSEIEEDRREED